jgi:hypothetical protein
MFSSTALQKGGHDVRSLEVMNRSDDGCLRFKARKRDPSLGRRHDEDSDDLFGVMGTVATRKPVY